MSDEVLGRDVSVQCKVDGDYVTIGCAFSVSFTFENELIGKTDVNAGFFRKKRVRISNVRGSVQGLITLNNTPTRLSIFYFLQEGIRRSELDMQFVFEDVAGGIKVLQGLFVVQSIPLTADILGFGEFDLQLEGTGNISIGTIEDPGEVVCDELLSDWWETTPGASGISGPGHHGRDYAGKRVIYVGREGTGHDLIDSGVPGNREAKYTGAASITFDPTNPFNPEERITVIWVDDGGS